MPSGSEEISGIKSLDKDTRIVIDSNAIFSILIKGNVAKKILFENDFLAYVPQFMFSELRKYEEYLRSKSVFCKEGFDFTLESLEARIQSIPNIVTESFMPRARSLCPDPGDADFFALALMLKCPIWSNDKALARQDIINIMTTGDMWKICA